MPRATCPCPQSLGAIVTLEGTGPQSSANPPPSAIEGKGCRTTLGGGHTGPPRLHPAQSSSPDTATGVTSQGACGGCFFIARCVPETEFHGFGSSLPGKPPCLSSLYPLQKPRHVYSHQSPGTPPTGGPDWGGNDKPLLRSPTGVEQAALQMLGSFICTTSAAAPSFLLLCSQEDTSSQICNLPKVTLLLSGDRKSEPPRYQDQAPHL